MATPVHARCDALLGAAMLRYGDNAWEQTRILDAVQAHWPAALQTVFEEALMQAGLASDAVVSLNGNEPRLDAFLQSLSMREARSLRATLDGSGDRSETYTLVRRAFYRVLLNASAVPDAAIQHLGSFCGLPATGTTAGAAALPRERIAEYVAVVALPRPPMPDYLESILHQP
jgi:hypothetical protein